MGSLVISIATVAITTYIWNSHWMSHPEPGVIWRPNDNIPAMYFLMPIGWLISILAPWGWVTLGGLFWAVYKVSNRALYFSFSGVFFFGLYWPFWFAAMMGI